jgi:hypothetical protein
MAISATSAVQSGDRSATFLLTAVANDTATLNAIAAYTGLAASSSIKSKLLETTATQTLAWFAANGINISVVCDAAQANGGVQLSAAGTLKFLDSGSYAVRISLAHSATA